MDNCTGSRLELQDCSQLISRSDAACRVRMCDVAAYQRHWLARVAVCGAGHADRMKSGRARWIFPLVAQDLPCSVALSSKACSIPVAGIDGHGPHRVLCVVSAPRGTGGGSTVDFVLDDEHGFLGIIPKQGQGGTLFITAPIIALVIALITTLIATITATTTTAIIQLWIVRLIKSIRAVSTRTKSGHNYSESKTIIQTVEAAASSIVEDSTATFRTVTVTGTPAVSTIAAAADKNNSDTPSATLSAAASSTPHSDGGGSGLKQGTIVGIAVGGSAAGVFVGLIAFMVWRRNRYKGDDDGESSSRGQGGEEVQGVVNYFGGTEGGATSIKRDNTSASEDSRMGAFGQNKNLYRNSIGSLEDTSSDWGQVLRVVNPDMPEKQH
ncbi:hypothetical protein G3M48_010540 [Beauveria asiatica]|uniref:Uncharacterized protein n=1 Tax=Beauveria asiatica TaxID=1069075 RepID=A0AAW0RHD8_9HYPO